MTEITCPCCDRFRFVTEPVLARLQRQQCCIDTNIICQICWRVFLRVIRRRLARRKRVGGM